MEDLSTMPEDEPKPTLTQVVESLANGSRVDHLLARLHPAYSRVAFQRVIEQQAVKVNGQPVKTSRRVYTDDVIEYQLPEDPDRTVVAEEIPLDILYDDDAFVVINKAANMIVHPGRGHPQGTLAAALQFHFDRLSDVAGKFRAGIVHRLDRDTSGVLVVAKDNQVHQNLSKQFEQRTVEKEYRAIVWGEPQFDRDYIETHVRVSHRNRERMIVCAQEGNSRFASTFYEVQERFRGFSFMRLCPQTGRTHQLRVHLHHLGHPIVADRLYEGKTQLRLSDIVPELPEEQDEVLIARQALHALRLCFDHPITGQRMEFEAPLPADITNTLAAIRQHRSYPPRQKK